MRTQQVLRGAPAAQSELVDTPVQQLTKVQTPWLVPKASCAPAIDRDLDRTCACASAAKYAVLTQPDAIPAAAKEKVGLLFGKYLGW